MADDQLRDVIQGLRSRLQDELEAQLEALARSHEQAVDEVRRAVEAEAEQRLSSRLEAANQEFASRLESERAAVEAEAEQRLSSRLEAANREFVSRLESERAAARAEAEQQLSSRLESELAAARAEAEQRLFSGLDAASQQFTSRLEDELAAVRADAEKQIAAESMRARLEATQAAAESATRARGEFEEALAEERTRAQEQLDSERQRAERELAEAQVALENERRRAEEAIETARTAPAPGADGVRLLEAIRRLDEATALSDVLTMVTNAAAAEAPRVTLFIVNTDHLEPWTVEGAASMSAGWVRVDGREAGLLGDAFRQHRAIVTSPGGAVAPAFASLPPERNACAVPFVLGGQPVAVLYADEGPEGPAPQAWQDAIQILGRHASACAAHITAVRTTQAVRLLGGRPTGTQAGGDGSDDEQGARRYARLLVSEIKLYNESAVRLGRQKRDLLQRLRPEIDRARRLYDDRIPASVSARDAYFQQELVQTLADGDPALLG